MTVVQTHPHVFVPLGDLNAAAYNPRVMTDVEMKKLVRSLREFGFVEPVIAREEDGLLIGGHQRCVALRTLLTEDGVTPEEIDAHEVPVVLLKDVSDERAKLLNVALNKIHGEWDFDKLGDLYSSLTDILNKDDLELSGFSTSEIDDVLALAGSAPLMDFGKSDEDDDNGADAVAARARKFSFEVETDAEAAFVMKVLVDAGMTTPKTASVAFLALCRAASTTFAPQPTIIPSVSTGVLVEPSAPARRRRQPALVSEG